MPATLCVREWTRALSAISFRLSPLSGALNVSLSVFVHCLFFLFPLFFGVFQLASSVSLRQTQLWFAFRVCCSAKGNIFKKYLNIRACVFRSLIFVDNGFGGPSDDVACAASTQHHPAGGPQQGGRAAGSQCGGLLRRGDGTRRGHASTHSGRLPAAPATGCGRSIGRWQRLKSECNKSVQRPTFDWLCMEMERISTGDFHRNSSFVFLFFLLLRFMFLPSFFGSDWRQLYLVKCVLCDLGT